MSTEIAAEAEGFVSRRTLVFRRFLRNRLAVASLVILVLLFSPATLQWLTQPPGHSSASADSVGPDTR